MSQNVYGAGRSWAPQTIVAVPEIDEAITQPNRPPVVAIGRHVQAAAQAQLPWMPGEADRGAPHSRLAGNVWYLIPEHRCPTPRQFERFRARKPRRAIPSKDYGKTSGEAVYGTRSQVTKVF